MSGWDALNHLPLRSKRSEAEHEEAARIRAALLEETARFARSHRREIYDRITDAGTKQVRVDDLLYRAAELFPGLVPTREEVAREAERMQMDKDGREIQQGILVSELLSDPAIGAHLISSMLAPTEEAREKLPELEARGVVDLGAARVEARGEVGYVFMTHPRFLNAEDDETRGPLETAVDLVLLHPGLRMGVLRGEKVDHPKYASRRIFSSGINLTRLYHGKISYLFYLVRDLGLVHKLYRGLALEPQSLEGLETTLEKPWMAVVDGFAIGGGCQILLVVDYVIAEKGSYFSLPARKEGIIPGAANLRLPRFMGERMARQAILFDRLFRVEEPDARALVNEVHSPLAIDEAVDRAIANALGSGMVSASGNRKALRVQLEPLDTFRRYMATYARAQAYCHLSDQLIVNLEKHWQAKSRRP
ncbi:MAG TPA: enoyl-CoA hydratase/isomerase family protein [Vicinamibacteria bacterium]|nr:enoyl-CoA hydratase/isomerase family protein [Vicinamibacteria bacterium]